VIKLGVSVLDKSTNQWGMLTLLQLEQGGNRYYHFQPKGINKKDGLPVSGRWVTEPVIMADLDQFIPDPNIPEGILGSFATDQASGFSGTIVSLRLHINGCFHVSIQSDQILEETGTVPEATDFDIRRLVGEKIPVFTEQGLKKDREENPSPERIRPYSPRL